MLLGQQAGGTARGALLRVEQADQRGFAGRRRFGGQAKSGQVGKRLAFQWGAFRNSLGTARIAAQLKHQVGIASLGADIAIAIVAVGVEPNLAFAHLEAEPPLLVGGRGVIGSDQGQKYVLVVNKENVVEARPIQADRQHGAMRAITGGLKVEDRVIINGLLMARPGAKVEVVDAPPKEGAPARQAQR